MFLVTSVKVVFVTGVVSWRDVVRKLEAKSRRKEKIEWVRESPAE
jgi:hypothetical protein